MSYRRLLLKLSGEALAGGDDFGIREDVLAHVVSEISAVLDGGFELGLVIGGGNIFRGKEMAAGSMDRVAADHMGMLATCMNALALENAFKTAGMGAQVFSGLAIPGVVEDFDFRRARACLQDGSVAIFSAGTGNPYFTTDTAAVLRALEVEADCVVKGTKVDGVYDADPQKDPSARKYDVLSYSTVLADNLGVMDATAIALCRENNLPLHVYDMVQKGALLSLARQQKVGTLVNDSGSA
ncbi:MAG: UMP kinase [Gammaproteobacteria bacterium]|nr:MAG: UMP kinase [Gammaproteobacteria bacterium]